MIKSSVFVLSTGLVLVSACGGGFGNEKDACNTFAADICAKLYKCVDAATIKQQLGYSDQADCTTAVELKANCSNIACPQGTTYDSANAQICDNDINSAACNQTISFPPSCQSTSICR